MVRMRDGLARRRGFRRHLHRCLPVRGRRPAGSRCGRCPPRRTIPRAASRRASRKACARVGAALAAIGYFGHGTTVGTNALIQHRGVRTGLITTDGFRDLLEIGRQKRPDLYDLQADKPPVLVARDLRLEVPERVRHDGTVETALDEAGAARGRARAAGGRRAGGRGLLPLRLRAPRARGGARGASSPRNSPTPSPAPATRSRRSSASTSGCRPRW